MSLLRTPEDRELSRQLEAIGFGFFILIFFIMIGVDFNLPARLSLIIAAAAIGKKLGIIDESVNAGVILVAIATVMAAPLAFLRVFQAPGVKVEQSMVRDSELAAPSPVRITVYHDESHPSPSICRSHGVKSSALSFPAAPSARFLRLLAKQHQGALLGSLLTAQFMELAPLPFGLEERIPLPQTFKAIEIVRPGPFYAAVFPSQVPKSENLHIRVIYHHDSANR